MPVLSVNNDAVVKYTNRLEQFNKTALPYATRSALNGAALDVKRVTMPASAATEFLQRDKNFFKATSRVEFATGNDLNNMRAVVGFDKAALKSENNQAVDDLEQQEHGGKISGRAFMPLDGARVGGKKTGKVKPQFRISKIDRIIKAQDLQGTSEKERFVKAVIHAGPGGFVLGAQGTSLNGKQILWQVNSFSSNLKTRQVNMKLTAIYSYQPGRAANIKKRTQFMEKASNQSQKKIEQIFINEAQRLFNKIKI